MSRAHNVHMLDQQFTFDKLLWACTFTEPGDLALETYYGTYSIGIDGLWRGVALPQWHKYYPYYRVMDEFSGIAYYMIHLGTFDQFSDMWYDAFGAAMKQAALEVTRRHESLT